MDRISQFPDELLLRILSFLPTTKDVVPTMLLSKRWQFLWMMMPKLVYDYSYQNVKYKRFSTFVYRYLLLHEAPTIEKLHIKLGMGSCLEDIEVWIRTAVKRCLRELIMEIDNSSSDNWLMLPMSLLYTGSRMLVTLKLNHVTLVDGCSSISFPSLKSLSLLSVEYPDEEFVKRLLSSCPVLDDLDVKQCLDDNVANFTVRVPSLNRLALHASKERYLHVEYGFVIDAPSLKHLDIRDHTGGYCVIENNMSKIVTTKVDVLYKSTGNILGSITSVKDLYLCLSSSKNAYPAGSVFHNLVHLKLCTCERRWLDLLMRLLSDSPNLQALKLEQLHDPEDGQPRPHWKEPSSVPECVKKRLETLEWVKYEGTKEEKQVAAFFLRSGRCLKKVKIIPHQSADSSKKKLKMIKELALLPRRSPTCQLVFN